MPLDNRHAVYAGSFDPLTLGHQNIITRGARIFDRVTVGIGINPDKQPLFAPEERVALIREVMRPVENVSVESFTGLAVDFVSSCGAGVILRGVRSLTDIESEFTMSLANSVLAPEIESVFLMAGEKFTHISSSLIKQIAQMGDDSSESKLREFVPQAIIGPLMKKVRNAR